MDDPRHSASEQIRQAGEEWANLNGAASLLEEMRKSILAEIGNQSGEKSAAAKDQYALAHQDYHKHIREMVEARTKANIAKAKWEALKIRVDIWRSKESSRKAEMQYLDRS